MKAEIDTLVALLCLKPESEAKLRSALTDLDAIPKGYWFMKGFDVIKPRGGTRHIVPAARELRLVQRHIATWMYQTFQANATKDYRYIGQSVAGAIRMHKGPYGVLLDIKDAYNQIHADRLLRWLLVRGSGKIASNLVPYIVELCTFNGITPQGCASTPYCFNLIMLEVDWLLELALKPHLQNFVMTRYVDNILISSPQPFDLANVRRAAEKVLIGSGFSISWNRVFDGSVPITYLGADIFPDHTQLAQEKEDIFFDNVIGATQHSQPLMFYKKITGMFAWATQICKPQIPDKLYQAFTHYYAVAGNWPASLCRRVLISS